MTSSSRGRKMRRITRARARKHLVAPPIKSRACGECSACCSALAVRDAAQPGMIEMDKAAGVHCEHELPGGGCAVYEKRPSGCRNYQCSWRFGDLELGIEARPDKLGVVFDRIAPREDVASGAADPAGQINVRPLSRDALVKLPLLCERLAKRYRCLVWHGEQIVGVMVPSDDNAL